VPLAGIPQWLDQDILLYHGTIDAHVAGILNGVDVTRGANLKDFGRGFYTTTRQDLASDWADQKAQQAGANPAVIEFQVSRNDIALLESLFFIRGDAHAIDYWSFVQYCRTIVGDHNRTYAAWYDLVAGPITGSWKKQTTVSNSDQISFHTPNGAAVLDGSQKQQII
jgi:hypothetical protein